jgi:hypothetical protein
VEILIAIDKFLQLQLVRWFLLASTLALMIAAGIYKARLGTTELQLKAAKGDVATYAAHIEAQNAAVAKAGAEYTEQKKKAQAAQQTAGVLKKELDRLGGITVAPNGCAEMVMQALLEVRK